MRSLIVDGRLCIPSYWTAAEVRERRAQLEAEIAKIDGQLNDPGRIARYAGEALYDDWKRRALIARDKLREELPFLDAWLVEQEEDYEAFWRE